MAGFIFFVFIIFLIYKIFKRTSLKKFEIQHVDLNSLNANKTEELPYIKREYFMTNAELKFFRDLEGVNQQKYFIVPQVALSKLVRVDDAELMKRTYHNKIDRKSVDFVLFDKETFEPKLVVELDDRSHDRYDRKIRDTWVDKVMDTVGIKILHIHSIQSAYDSKPIVALLNA